MSDERRTCRNGCCYYHEGTRKWNTDATVNVSYCPSTGRELLPGGEEGPEPPAAQVGPGVEEMLEWLRERYELAIEPVYPGGYDWMLLKKDENVVVHYGGEWGETFADAIRAAYEWAQARAQGGEPR